MPPTPGTPGYTPGSPDNAWSAPQPRELSPREQRIDALGGTTSWHGYTPGNVSSFEARKSLMEQGWDPSMGYGPQNWAAMGVTNPNVAQQLDTTLFGISPMSQTDKNWQPTAWRTPQEIARMQSNYDKMAATMGPYNQRGSPAWQLAKRLQQKGFGWLGAEQIDPRLSIDQLRSLAGAHAGLSTADPATAMQQQAARAAASMPGGVMPDAMKRILGMFPGAPAQPAPAAEEAAPNWFQYNLPAWGTGNAQNTTLQSLLGL